jgi:hypothetical protein
MKPIRTLLAALGCLLLLTTALHAQVPNLLNYQGRVAVGTGASAVNFNGTGQFKFALVQGAGPTLLWKNDGSAGNTAPATAVPLTVTKGLYSVLLGDTSPPLSMAAIPASVWSNADVRLRVWFDDGTNGFQLLTPDQRLAPNGYLPDGSVSSTALASGAVTTAKIASGAVTSTQLATGAVQAANIAAGAVDSTKIASVSIATTNLANSAVTAAKLGSDVGLWSVSGADVFRSSGNVGIGKNDPQTPLDVNGRVTATGLESRSIGGTPFIDFSSDNVDFNARILYTGTSTDTLQFQAGKYALLNGNVGIGTSTPGEKLTVVGTGTASTSSALSVFNSGLGSLLRVRDDGNVGIGTTDPQTKLDVNGVAQAQGLELRENGGTPYIDFSGAAGVDNNARIIYTGTADNGLIYNSYKHVFYGGFVGIGKNPSTLLDVAGDLTLNKNNGASLLMKDPVSDPNGWWGLEHNAFGNGNLGFVRRDNSGSHQAQSVWIVPSGEIYCTAINLTSDRNAKEEFKPVNARAVLDKVARLPITEWQYKGRDKEPSDGTRHIGPMAQDFHEAFALGHDDKHITSVDADGVALAAIQGLNEKLEETRTENAELKRTVEELKELVTKLARQQDGGAK